MLILWIKSKSAFLRFTIWSFFWERICKKYFRKLHQSSIYISRLFWNSYFSCFLYVSSVCLHRFIFQVIQKKKNKTKQFICASVLNSSNFIIPRPVYSIRETFVFQTETYSFRIFIRSLCYFSFLSSPDQFVVFSSILLITRNMRTCRCHGKWSSFFW